MNRRDRLAVAGLFLAVLVAGAMLVVRVPSGAKQSPSPGIAGVTYREGIVGHPSSINPLTPRSQADQDLVALLFRGLVRAGLNGTIQPDLATWTVSKDGLTYTFKIRDDAYWEDGQPVVAADVVFTIGLIQDARYDGPVGSSWQGVHAIADSASVVRFTMTLPNAGFLRQAELSILPSHLLKGTLVTKLADSGYSARPVGNGPYRIIELDYSHALLERVTSVTAAPTLPPTAPPSVTPIPTSTPIKFATETPRPTRPPEQTATPVPTPTPTPTPTPAPTPTPTPTSTPTSVPLASGAVLTGVSHIALTFYDDSASAEGDFRAGKLDAVGGLTEDQTDAALTTAGSRLIPYRWASLLSVVVNQRLDYPELRDANARTGLLAAIDRQTLLDDVLKGRGTVAALPIPSWSTSYESASVTGAPYDVAAAEEYLAAAGWERTYAGWIAPKDDSPYTMKLLTLDEASNPLAYETALWVAAAWRAIGLTVEVEAVPTFTYMERVDGGRFAAAIVTFEVGLDADLGPLLLSSQVGAGGSNVAGLQDPALDPLLMAVRKAVLPAARREAVAAVEEYISTMVPILPLVFRDYGVVVSDRVRGMTSSQIADPSGRFWDVIDWRLASAR